MRWILVLLLALSCLSVSAVAAYFSIIGLAQLFAAAVMPVIVMGVVLETAKVITTGWLHIYWRDAPRRLRYPLASMVVALMLITSVGIFGFLSAGHLEQTAPADQKRITIERLDQQIARRTEVINRYDAQLKQLDDSIAVFLKNERATQGLAERRKQQQERQEIATALRDEQRELDRIHADRLELRQSLGVVEAKLGPVKYLAKALGMEHDPETAVLIVIAILMFAFDPLAILLVIATVMTVQGFRKPDLEADFLADSGPAKTVDKPVEPPTRSTVAPLVNDLLTLNNPEPTPAVDRSAKSSAKPAVEADFKPDLAADEDVIRKAVLAVIDAVRPQPAPVQPPAAQPVSEAVNEPVEHDEYGPAPKPAEDYREPQAPAVRDFGRGRWRKR